LRVLGIDPGTNITGYGIIEIQKGRIAGLAFGEIKTPHASLPHCLKSIYDELMLIVREWNPDAIAIEDVFYGKNVRSLIKQGQARGVAMLVAPHNNIPVYEYTPLEVKKAVVGYGRAEKSQVQFMVKAILNLPEVPPVDASDALAVAICHSHCMKAGPR